MRRRVHAAVPTVEESLKWGAPAYLADGKILLVTAAFKQHAAVSFWRGDELGLAKNDGRGQLGRLTSTADLPPDFDALLLRAHALSASPAPKKPKAAGKPEAPLHPDFIAALAAHPAAKATLDAFSPSHRREYSAWIAEAKRDETRARRIATAIEWLTEGKARNWRYQDC